MRKGNWSRRINEINVDDICFTRYSPIYAPVRQASTVQLWRKWAATADVIHPSATDTDLSIPGLHPLMDCRKRTAPTPEQVIEEQAADIARLEGLIAGMEHEAACNGHWFTRAGCNCIKSKVTKS